MNEVAGILSGLTDQKPKTSLYRKLWNTLLFGNNSQSRSSASLNSPLAYAVLDSLQEQIAVIDRTGSIQFVNSGWKEFARNNECKIVEDWIGINYLEVCQKAGGKGDVSSTQTYEGIKSVLAGQREVFSFEYPCHSPTAKRWFMMTIASLSNTDQRLFSICHRDITDRKLSEEKAQKLARTDDLTGLANRRQFNEYLEKEWRRSTRNQTFLTMMVLDLDHFKELNDIFGHPAGDCRLETVGRILQSYTHRAGDICARLGGDEFIVVFEDITSNDAKRFASQILHAIKSLKIDNPDNRLHPAFTASMGIIRHIPTQESSSHKMVGMADQNLYEAKKNGGNTFRLTDIDNLSLAASLLPKKNPANLRSRGW